jgi:hypothetical protein
MVGKTVSVFNEIILVLERMVIETKFYKGNRTLYTRLN